MDENPVQVLREPGRENTTKSYMWVARGGRESIIHVGCLAHVRRKFHDVLKAGGKKKKGGVAQAVLNLIAKVYKKEKQARQQGSTPPEILAMRQKEIKPLLDKIKNILFEKGPLTPPKSLLGKAASYALGQRPRITAYLENPDLTPDNNAAENAIRPFAVGRKNWLFAGSPRGAKASAAIYSLIESAKANGLNPLDYLNNLFDKLPKAKSEQDLRQLLPGRIPAKSSAA